MNNLSKIIKSELDYQQDHGDSGALAERISHRILADLDEMLPHETSVTIHRLGQIRDGRVRLTVSDADNKDRTVWGATIEACIMGMDGTTHCPHCDENKDLDAHIVSGHSVDICEDCLLALTLRCSRCHGDFWTDDMTELRGTDGAPDGPYCAECAEWVRNPHRRERAESLEHKGGKAVEL